MDSTLLYADTLLRQPTRFTVTSAASSATTPYYNSSPRSSPLNSPRSSPLNSPSPSKQRRFDFSSTTTTAYSSSSSSNQSQSTSTPVSNTKSSKSTATLPNPAAKLRDPKKQRNNKKQSTSEKTATDKDSNNSKSNSFRDMIMKRKLFTKLLRALTLKDVTGSAGKTYPRDFRAKHASAKRKRARNSNSSVNNFEPMPTIYEESESDLVSIQSTIHHHYGSLLKNQHTLVDAV